MSQIPSDMQQIPVREIRGLLFTDERLIKKLHKMYPGAVTTRGDELERHILKALGQTESPPTEGRFTNQEIFRAATLAISSNSRSWARVSMHRHELCRELSNYVPERVVADIDRCKMIVAKILGGITAKADAKSIANWAIVLSTNPDYYSWLMERRELLVNSLNRKIHPELSYPETTAVVAASLGNKRIIGATPESQPQLATPGMGPTLASEFLRNLGWTGFKPDRHIIRLMRGWFPKNVEVQERTNAICDGLRLHNNKTREFIYHSLLGARMTPQQESINTTDQLVWLYGAVTGTKHIAAHASYQP